MGRAGRYGDRIPVRGARFSAPLQSGPPSLLYKGYVISIPGIKRSVRGVDHPVLLAPRLKRE